MGGPLEQAGAVREPSEYAALSMDRAITGLWTQRSPLRDADVPYLYGKFYSASRFDSLIDGINREVTAKLTYRRRPGSSVYNSNTFPAINSFYPYKRISNGAEILRVIADGADGNVYDATAGQKTTIFTKSGGAGKARFAGVNTSLYFTDGVENKKWIQPSTWTAQTTLATTQYSIGTSVLDNESPPKLQYLSSFKVGNVTNVVLAGNVVTLTFNNTNFAMVQGMTFSVNLTTATFLNTKQLIALSVIASGATFIVTANCPAIPYASAADTGTASTTDVGTPVTTGGSQPAWNTTVGASTTDGLSTWVNFGNPVYDWGPPAAPSQAPTISQPFAPGATFGTMGIWQANTLITQQTSILDDAGNIQTTTSASVTGGKYPNFALPGGPGVPSSPSYPYPTTDGAQVWFVSAWFGNLFGQNGPSSWVATTAPKAAQVSGGDVLVDSNGNLQMAISAAPGNKSGAAAPTWNTNYGGSTLDNGGGGGAGITWRNIGPYLALAFSTGWQWGYAYHCIDGSVSTTSPLSPPTYAVVGGVPIAGVGTGNPSCDSIWIFRTASGQATPVWLYQIPNPGAGIAWTFSDQNTDFSLVAEIPAPLNDSNNPPPIGMTAPLYHQGRIWAIYQNTVIRSGGPNVVTGNGNTSFAPLDFTPIPEQPIRITPTLTSQGSATLIWGRANIYLVLGDGSANNPYQPAVVYMARTGIMNYDALTQVGSTFYAFGNTALLGGDVVGKAFSLDPGAGYVEFGFPIGDQFDNVSTGTGGKIPGSPPTGYLYNPASTFVTWAELGSGDTAIYVADGSVGWFRYSPVASPEAGFLWSPRAVIVGGTSAVQGIETQPGVTQLLIGPASSGPILFRDLEVSGDWHNGVSTAFPSYDVKGCIQLCLSGEVAEVAHVHVVSLPQGARPSVGLLFGEILASTASPFAWYDKTTNEPPILPASQSVYSDRYTMLSRGVTPKCLFFQLGMDYGTQLFPDETLMFTVYGAKFAERKQQ